MNHRSQMTPEARFRDLIKNDGLDVLEAGQDGLSELNQRYIASLQRLEGSPGFELPEQTREDLREHDWAAHILRAAAQHLQQRPLQNPGIPSSIFSALLAIAARLAKEHMQYDDDNEPETSWDKAALRAFNDMVIEIDLHLLKSGQVARSLECDVRYRVKSAILPNLGLHYARDMHADLAIGVGAKLTVADVAGRPMPIKAFEFATGARITHGVATCVKTVFPSHFQEQKTTMSGEQAELQAHGGALAGAALYRYTFFRAQEVDPAGFAELLGTMTEEEIAILHRSYAIAASGRFWELYLLEIDDFRQAPQGVRPSKKVQSVLQASIDDNQSMHRLFLALATTLLQETEVRRNYVPKLLKLAHPNADPAAPPVVSPPAGPGSSRSGSARSESGSSRRSDRIAARATVAAGTNTPDARGGGPGGGGGGGGPGAGATRRAHDVPADVFWRAQYNDNVRARLRFIRSWQRDVGAVQSMSEPADGAAAPTDPGDEGQLAMAEQMAH